MSDPGVKTPAMKKNSAIPNRAPITSSRMARVSNGSWTCGSSKTHVPTPVQAIVA
ncbi:MAG TPA: hypothetical protein VIL87_02670 [Dermatophilaceae bacterium]